MKARIVGQLISFVVFLATPALLPAADFVTLGVSRLYEGPLAGSDTVALTASSPTLAWMATADVSWLHLSGTNGSGSTNLLFSFDANPNPGAARTGTLTIGGVILWVVQGGAATSFAATGVGITNATLHGCVLPKGSTTGSFFQYSTNGGWLMSDVARGVVDYCSARSYLTVDNGTNFYFSNPDCSFLNLVRLVVTNGVTNAQSLYWKPFWGYQWRPGPVFVVNSNTFLIPDFWSIRQGTIDLTSSNELTLTGAFAGDPNVTQQDVDGYGTNARFWTILGMVRDSAGDFYVGEAYRLRWVSGKTAQVISLTDQGTSAGTRDGPAFGTADQVALIDCAAGVAVDAAGTVYFSQYSIDNSCIRKLATNANHTAWITTVAGTNVVGYADGTGSAARFKFPSNLVLDKAGDLYVLDGGNQCLRKMSPERVVTTLACRETSTGRDVTFHLRVGLTQDSAGNLYVVDGESGSIQRMDYGLQAPVTTVAVQGGLTGTNTVAMNQVVSGLWPGMNYFYRSMSTNSAGTNYGEILSFSTPQTNSTLALASSLNPFPSYGTSVTFTATISIANPTWPAAVGTVLFKDGGVTLGTGTLINGVATFTTNHLDVGTHYLTAEFPGDVHYFGSTNSSLLVQTVYMGSPNVTAWPTTTNVLLYGWELSRATLQGGDAYPPGSFAWANPALVPSAGTNAQTVVFTPADIANCSTTNGTAIVAVRQLTPGVHWPVAAPLLPGQALSAATLSGGSATIPGTFAWANPALVPGVGTSPESMIFTPTDSIDYKLMTSSVDVRVKDRLPVATNDVLNAAMNFPVTVPGSVLVANDTPPTGYTLTVTNVSYTGGHGGTVVLSGGNITYTPGAGYVGTDTFAYTAADVDGWAATGTVTVAVIPLSATLATSSLVEGPAAGSDSVTLVGLPSLSWTTAANAGWLHVITPGGGPGYTNVIFTFDANPGPTRNGTLTIAGQTVSVLQAGTTYAAANTPITLVSSGLSFPLAVAADPGGNLYIADTYTNALKKWSVASATVSTLVSTGLTRPSGVAVDGAGNVYIADTGANALKRWNASDGTVSTLLSSGLGSPAGLAMDAGGYVYIANTGNNTVRKFNPADGTVTNLVSSGLGGPTGVAVDIASNIFIGDNSYLDRWNAASKSLTTLASGFGSLSATGVGVDSSGNVYFADTSYNAIRKWSVSNSNVTTLLASGIYHPQGLALDSSGNIYFTDPGNCAVKELPHAFLDPTPRNEPAGGGLDTLPPVLPATMNLSGPLAPVSDQPWLAITGVAGGVVSFNLEPNAGLEARTAHITLLGRSITVTQRASQACTLALATINRVEGPAAGTDSVLLAISAGTAWTATANAPWLHLAMSGGFGPGVVSFTFDTNAGATRSGTLTIAGQTLTVVQAGASWSAANLVATLVSAGLSSPAGVAVDRVGNVYIADQAHNALVKWNAADGSVTNLVASGLNAPRGVAVDVFGNVYIADTGNNAVKEWTAADGSVSTLVPTGLNAPAGLALDGSGNVYVADTQNNAIQKWDAASGSVATLVSGLNAPGGVAVDAAGNVYIADTGSGAIREWNAVDASVRALVSTGLNAPAGVAVDAGGNVYIADTGNGAIKEWNAASGTVSVLLSTGLNSPAGVAVDGSGSVYLADLGNNAIKEIPRAFVDTTARTEPLLSGMERLRVVLPAAQALSGALAPASDQSWLTILGASNGTVIAGFSASPGSARTANISLLGRSIPVTQPAEWCSLGTTNLLEGPAAGADSVTLGVSPPTCAWTAAANAEWLHLSAPGGVGSTNVIFTFDANPGATRAGTLTVAGQTLSVTQAGSTYTAAGSLTTLLSPWIPAAAPLAGRALGVAVDGSGNVYGSFYVYGQSGTVATPVQKWEAASGAVSTLPSSDLNRPAGLAADNWGNLDIADQNANTIKKWEPASGVVSTLVSSGLSGPSAVAPDGYGNLYIADSGHNLIAKWSAASNTLSTLVPATAGLSSPNAVAVDAAGNVYIADTSHKLIKKWSAADGSLSTLASTNTGLLYPYGVAVDGSGNVYIADLVGMRKWSAVSGAVTALIPSGLDRPGSVAVDPGGNLYIAELYGHVVKEQPRAFVDATARIEPAAGGSDSLPAVLPSTQNLSGLFAPVSDQSWLTITGVTNGVVAYSFSPNPGTNRTAQVTVLGQAVAVIQAGTMDPGQRPAIRVALQGATVVLSWLAPANFFTLQSRDSLSSETTWQDLAVAQQESGGWSSVTIPSPTGTRFFRLSKSR